MATLKVELTETDIKQAIVKHVLELHGAVVDLSQVRLVHIKADESDPRGSNPERFSAWAPVKEIKQ